MDITAVLAIYGIGAASLVAWLFARFPSLGPHGMKGILIAMVAAWMGMQLALSLFHPIAGAVPYGPALAMLLLVLPALTAAFWTALCMLRLLANLRG